MDTTNIIYKIAYTHTNHRTEGCWNTNKNDDDDDNIIQKTHSNKTDIDQQT
jgi:hypothetical protein